MVFSIENRSLVPVGRVTIMVSNDLNQRAREKAEGLITSKPPYYYSIPKSEYPDVWLLPGQVWKISSRKIRRSPYRIAEVEGELKPANIEISENIFLLW